MRLLSRGLAACLLLASAACAGDGTRTLLPEPPPAPLPLGVYQIAVTGIGNGELRSTILPARSGGPRSALTNAGSGISFEQVSSTSFTEGTRTANGQRYIQFTYRVRNGTGAPLSNLTMLMVQRAGTISGTPLSSLKRFDGTSADPAIAPLVVPTGAVALRGDLVSMSALDPDVMQVFTEAEVAAITPPGDVTNIFPYGYMVRSATSTANRTLPNAATPNQFDGVLTLSFRLPLQASSAQDVFSLVFEVLAVQDGETRLTESMEEAQDSAAVRRLRDRATSLGATTVTVLAGSTVTAADVADYPGQRQICSARTAGTAGSPVTFTNAPAGYAQLAVYLSGESVSACGANFHSGTASAPVINSPYPVTVRAMDRYGNVRTSTADTVTLGQTSGPSATFPAAGALASGAATMNVTWTGAGTSALTATGRRLRGARSVAIPATATIAVNGGNNQAAMAGTAITTAPSVIVRDLSNNPLANQQVTFTVTGGGGSVTGGTAMTNASGIATLGSWTLGSPGALNTLSASTPAASTPASFTASGCSGGGGSGYAITLCYTTAMTAAQRSAFDGAAARWAEIITGDLGNVTTSVAQGACGTNSPSFSNLTIDDLLIFAGVEAIDGAGGILGSAGWCFRRAASLPLIGVMRFDAADMASMEANGLLPGVIRHEMGHVIGIGTLWSGFLVNASPVGGPPADTYFNGANAINGFNTIGGSTYTGGQKVPVENTGGAGTINAHWRESVLANELMTGYASVGSMPLSAMTVGSLADIGYTVDSSKADAFFLTLTVRAEGAPAGVPLGNDVLPLPQYSIDTHGRFNRLR